MTSRKTAEQLPLAFGHDPATGRDDLLIAEPVDAAVAMIDAWPHWPAPVVIIATSGSTATPKGVVFTNRSMTAYAACWSLERMPNCSQTARSCQG